MQDEWLDRWERGRTGWHEQGGNAFLKKYWPHRRQDLRVLVPLCGKSPDLLWLAQQGNAVIGAEISDIAVRGFFTDNELEFTSEPDGAFERYSATSLPVTIYRGDYFSLEIPPCDALYDRGSLVALPAGKRPDYVRHTKALLATHATRLIISLDYDQSVVDGPPFSLHHRELLGYWPDLKKMDEKEDIANGPPKFRDAGLNEMHEAVWLGR